MQWYSIQDAFYLVIIMTYCSFHICMHCLHCFYALHAAALNIRLANCVNPFDGRVEHYYAGSWGTVCDSRWNMNDANVACRQLGLGRALKATTGSFFGRGSGRTVLSNVNCTGNETALGWCLHSGWNRGNCSQSAAVVCEGKEGLQVD